ncbi:hypothetical protein Hanom_Chr13g01238001 [Helianthus anomalus]
MPVTVVISASQHRLYCLLMSYQTFVSSIPKTFGIQLHLGAIVLQSLFGRSSISVRSGETG